MSEEGSLADLAEKGLKRILELSKSKDPVDKLQSLNILIFVLSFTWMCVYYLGGALNQGLAFYAVVLVSGLFGFIIALPYFYILEILVNISNRNEFSIKTSNAFLFLAAALGSVSVATMNENFIKLSSITVLIGLLVIPFVRGQPPQVDSENVSSFWTWLGRIDSIIGVVSAIIQIVIIFFR